MTPRRSIISEVFLILVAALWILPVLWSVYLAFRPLEETNKYGYVSWPRSLTLQNFRDAWTQGSVLHYFVNSLWITIPAVVLTLLLSSALAFVIARLRYRWTLPLLLVFTAGNLLPQQVFLAPLFKIYNSVGLPTWLADSGKLYDSTFGLVVINVAFQLGFCVFVLANFMKTVPASIQEAAIVDGAGIWTQYWRITLPLCRPALAAMATLLTIWIYNDFFWALALISTGDKYPITTALNDLKGQYAVDNNLLAAGALIVAAPTLVVYLVLQRHFIAGLTLGSTKE
ncbi:carbohydrate ABC transporter membrane protein 2, CUT1 family (TC 3.A.1.1.-) [Nocardioides terrae]|uniref:Carbohydrate ABC transporter membrane protein 2, CUT1 family (TC 3.A.1.1.-) n=1 Tax=Nocardioides terrae TaxID=574651 RepID=A0A1I1EYN1_9ACTN|nr:carbohydrate ABC transporter permease [Nocardioides terrae]SFB92255.1 carbohydrate ABC transporter membrane protein 2, CUT1 family (TC 3.A.1.1.-) [Nocardioides terrae]